MEGLGTKLQRLRRARRISQEKIGREIGKSQAFISQIESNKRTPSIETLEKIESFLEVEPGGLQQEVDILERELLQKHLSSLPLEIVQSLNRLIDSVRSR